MKEKGSLCATGAFLEIPNSQSTMQGHQSYTYSTEQIPQTVGSCSMLRLRKYTQKLGIS